MAATLSSAMHPLDTLWEDIKREFSAACNQSAQAGRAEVFYELNQVLRRFRQYEGEADWVRLVIESASAFARQVALFSLENDVLNLRGQVNLEVPEVLTFPPGWAGAFEAVCQSKDTITALRTAGEVTEALSASDSGERAHLFPIANGSRLAAVLFASDGADTDVNALELISGMASSVLERQSNATLHSQILLGVQSAPMEQRALAAVGTDAPVAKPAARLPTWTELDEKQRHLHIRAQRFARVTVAEMQLAKPEACRAGREQGDYYLFLNKEIDKAREIYRTQFMTIPSMVDYLHLELVHTAAEGDEEKLGADYPGQLV